MDDQPDLYLTTHNTDKRQTHTPSEGFEPTIPAGDRPQVHAIDRAATVISTLLSWLHQNILAAVSPRCKLLSLALRALNQSLRSYLGSNNPPSGSHDLFSEVK
jgi:hypothetical protein